VFGLRLALPEGMSWRHLGGVSALAGIGFTVSIFIAGLAFEDPLANDAAKVGILVASLLAGAVGAAVLLTGGRSSHPDDPDG
jgi:NhaA family Na+:H+ antiporter